MSRSVLILGGTGFLGSALRRELENDPEYEVFFSSTSKDEDSHHITLDLLNATDGMKLRNFDIIINLTG